MLGKDDLRRMVFTKWGAPFSTKGTLCPGGSSMQPWE